MIGFTAIAVSDWVIWGTAAISLSLVAATLLAMAADFLKTYRTHNFGPGLLWLYRSRRHRWLLRLEPLTRLLPFTDGGTRALGYLLKAYFYRANGLDDMEYRCLAAASDGPLPVALWAECQVDLARIERGRGDTVRAEERLTVVTNVSEAPTRPEASMIVAGNLATQRVRAHTDLAALALIDNPEAAEFHVARAVSLQPECQRCWHNAAELYRRHPHLKCSDTAAGLFISGLRLDGPGYADFAAEVGLHLRALTGDELDDHVLPYLYRGRPYPVEDVENPPRVEVWGLVLKVLKKTIPDLPETRLLRCILSHLCGEQPPDDGGEHEVVAARTIAQENLCERIFRVLLEPLINDFDQVLAPVQASLVQGYGASDREAAEEAGREAIRLFKGWFATCDVSDGEDVKRRMWDFAAMLQSEAVTETAHDADAVMQAVLVGVTVHKAIPDEALWGLESLGIWPKVSGRVERALFGVVGRLGSSDCRDPECCDMCSGSQACTPTSVSCDCLNESLQMAMAETSLQVKLPSLVAVAIVAATLDRPLVAEQCIQAARLRAQQVGGDHQQVSVAGMLAEMLRPYFEETAREIAFSVHHTWCRYRSADLYSSNGPNKYMAKVVYRCMPEIWR